MIAVHTNWDAAAGGASDALAEALGVYDTEGFAASETMGEESVRAGRCGSFDGAAADLLAAVRESLSCRPRHRRIGARSNRPQGGRPSRFRRIPPG